MNIWRTRQVIEKLKTFGRSILIRCSSEIKTRQRIFHDTAPLTGCNAHSSLSHVLHTDASESGLGAVLYQEQNKVLRVIGYGSRTLTPAEKNYHLHSGKLEFLALKWAICEQFRDYLYYSPSFVVYTDNNPLTYVLSSAKLNATGLRWIGELADFNFTIRYRPGKTNVDADTSIQTS